MSGTSSFTLESYCDQLCRFSLELAEISRELDELLTRLVSDRNTGMINLGDYIDGAVETEAWLQNLAEGNDDGEGRRGAPPAAKSAIEALETFEVGSSERTIRVCAVCKDAMVVGEIGKKLPCGHSYHGNCILPWLRTRNSCPLCRFQLQTDDPQYERMKRRRVN